MSLMPGVVPLIAGVWVMDPSLIFEGRDAMVAAHEGTRLLELGLQVQPHFKHQT